MFEPLKFDCISLLCGRCVVCHGLFALSLGRLSSVAMALPPTSSHYENTPMQIYRKPPKTEIFQIKKKTDIFSYFCSKHRLWVLVRTASVRRF